MKSRKEIREEIGHSARAIKNHRAMYKNEKISKELLKDTIIDNEATIAALKWVLDENDRYD